MTGLLDLPAELIAAIASYLREERDVFAARLAHRHVERSSASYFGIRFFRKKGFLITTPSITVLKSIANHDELRKHVKHLWFNPDLWTYVVPACAAHPGAFKSGSSQCQSGSCAHEAKSCHEGRKPLLQFPASTAPLSHLQKYESFESCRWDHSDLLYGGPLDCELRDALLLLPNLKTIGMRRGEEHSPCGWSKLKDAVGEDPRTIGPQPSNRSASLSGPTHLFIAIVRAVALANATLARLYTDTIEIDNIRWHGNSGLSQKTREDACRSLLYLEINICKAPDWTHGLDHEILQKSDYGNGVVELLKATPQLRELGLQIFDRPLQSNFYNNRFRADDREHQKRSYPYLMFQKLADNVKLRHLTRLKIEKVVTTAEAFTAFLAPSQSCLTSIKIRNVRLLSFKASERPWQSVFEFLRDQCTELAYMLLYHLIHESGVVSFVERPQTPPGHYETLGMYIALDMPYSEPATEELFAPYDHINKEVSGKEEVKACLAQLVEGHFYETPMFSYAMDNEIWHTDTSDEEW